MLVLSSTDHGCPLADEDRAVLQAFEDEVVDRLCVLDAERAREEQRPGLGKRARASRDDGGEAPRAPRTSRAKKPPGNQGDLC